MNINIAVGRTRRGGMVRVLRRAGIAVGASVVALLAMSLAGLVIRPPAEWAALRWLFTFALGGLIYLDIVRGDRRPPRTTIPRKADG
jgi:hypothetical protein